MSAEQIVTDIVSASLRFFFLLTPFFVLSMFIVMTGDFTGPVRRRLADKVSFSALAICLVLLFFGRWIFTIFGITVDAFRIGGGVLLLLSAIKLVNGAAGEAAKKNTEDPNTDISVVPLAIPVTVGPATTGALLIIGAEMRSVTALLINAASLVIARTMVWAILRGSNLLERLLKRKGIVILSKLTGLILAALASEMIFTGIRAFLVVKQ